MGGSRAHSDARHVELVKTARTDRTESAERRKVGGEQRKHMNREKNHHVHAINNILLVKYYLI